MTSPPNGADELQFPNEAFDAEGRPRGAYARLFERLGPADLVAARDPIRRALEARGVRFGGGAPRLFDVDPVPRLVEADEWERLELGLAQRARALNAFLDDVYGERRIVAAGVVEAELLEGAEWFEPAMGHDGMPPVRAHVAGPDLVRGADGLLRVLEDNLRAPSGLAYATAAREVMAPLVERSGLDPRPVSAGLDALASMLRSAAPEADAGGTVVLLNDGPSASAIFEHREIARRAGAAIATLGELRREGPRLMLGGEEVAVLYRRVDDERLQAPDGSLTPLGELLVEPLAAGRLACVNSPGSGIADDKAVHARVEAMIGFYLGEEALIESVPSRWLGEPGAVEDALDHLDEIVVKPRWEFGGAGILIGQVASAAERIRRDPAGHVAQELVALSVHPTVVGRALADRHVDLRPFVVTEGDNVTVVPGGLTRFARGEGEMVVNSGRGGGAKDTWILSR